MLVRGKRRDFGVCLRKGIWWLKVWGFNPFLTGKRHLLGFFHRKKVFFLGCFSDKSFGRHFVRRKNGDLGNSEEKSGVLGALQGKGVLGLFERKKRDLGGSFLRENGKLVGKRVEGHFL